MGPLANVVESAALRSVRVALKLGIFDLLEANSLTPAELSLKTGADNRALSLLLEMLRSFGYVRRNHGRYSNSSMTSEWLVQDSRSQLSEYIAMWNDLAFPFWDQYLEKTIIEGKPSRSFYGWINEQGKSSSQCFQNSMLDLSRLISSEIVRKATIPSNARSLLDVGGGHGLYSLKFCQKYPHLKATIIDFPNSLGTWNKLAGIEKMSNRISFHPANYLTDSLGSDKHDIALLFNVVHAHSTEENIELLRKVANSLRVGGRVMILELVSDDATLKKMPSIINFFNLAFLASFGTQMCSTIEIEKWLSAAGLLVVNRKSLTRIPGLRLVIGRKE